MNEPKPLACNDIGNVDPARIQVFAFDAHGFIPWLLPAPESDSVEP